MIESRAFPRGINDEVTSWRDKHLFYMYALTPAQLQPIQNEISLWFRSTAQWQAIYNAG